MVVVCQSDNTFYLRNKHGLKISGGLVAFNLKHDLETTIFGSCSATTNQGKYICICECVHLIINDVRKYTNGKTKGYIFYINQY